VTFESGVLFGYDEANVTADADKKLTELTEILNKYPDTYVLVEGHTDAAGSENYNEKLSKRRAQAVAKSLKRKGLDNSRIKTAWYGEAQPKVANDTESNMAKNRRVEFAIYANEELKKQAQEEAVSKK
jgi:outer membrane protein OmpA-like peptidoglycan-associated protein